MPPAAASSSANNRRQPARQARTSITRPLNYYARQYGTHGAQNGDSSMANDAPGFFPAITHFTDCIDALPKEMIGQLGMLKEVEVKIHGPNEELQQCMDELAKLPPPDHKRAVVGTPDFSRGLMSVNSTIGSFAGSVNGSVLNGSVLNGSVHNGATPVHFPTHAAEQMAVGVDPVDQKRRELYSHMRFTIAHMTPALDEKVAVLATANQTLANQLARMKSSFPYINEEISEEARVGSSTHWAYIDKEANKKAAANERTRRDVAAANNLAAAAAAVHEHDLAASRSEARREAMMAKRNRNQHVDSDFDDRPVAKKIAAKAKKQPAEAAGDKSVGLGITGAVQPSKRRKTEKGAAMAPAMERTISERAMNAGRASPRETPTAEIGRKKAARAPAPAPIRKRSAVHAASPPPVSSPSLPTAAINRPIYNRARQNSMTNPIRPLPTDARARPSSSASNRPGTAAATNEVDNSFLSRPLPYANQSHTLDTDEGLQAALAARPDSRAGAGVFKREGTMEGEPAVEQSNNTTIPPPVVTTRAGRVSKTATPIMTNFPDSAPMGRQRSARGHGAKESGTGGTGSGASSETAAGNGNGAGKRERAKRAKELPAEEEVLEGSDAGEVEDDDDEGDDGDEGEERYCYCQMPSFGEMIGCENDDCPRQWFHLKCLGMDAAPEGDWYCKECAKALGKASKGGKNGGWQAKGYPRPGQATA